MLDPTITQVSAGSEHACALTTTGVVKCWGRGAFVFSAKSDGRKLSTGVASAMKTVDFIGFTVHF